MMVVLQCLIWIVLRMVIWLIKLIGIHMETIVCGYVAVVSSIAVHNTATSNATSTSIVENATSVMLMWTG